MTFDEYKERWDYHMQLENWDSIWGSKAVTKPPPFEAPSLWWECAGIYTVYVLGCVLAYLQFGI
jgi:hypothetical protein